MEQPTPTYLEDEHVYQWSELGIELVFERFREERGELFADVQPRAVVGGGMLPGDKLNLGSARSQKMYANTLASRGLLESEDWFTIIGQACDLSKRRHREGEPSVRLSEVEWGDTPSFMLNPYVDAHGTTIIFGDGGVGKSLHALAIAASIASGESILPGTSVDVTGPTLYLDWEADAKTHAQRLAAICAGAQLEVPRDVHYMARTGSLSESVREVRRVIATEGIIFAVVDSVGAAGGGDPEKAETVIRTMTAMRALGVPPAALHHVTKDQKDKTKPFGSVYAPNLARRTWRVDGEQNEGEDSIAVRFTNYKANFGRLIGSRGHGVKFETDGEDHLTVVRFTELSGLALPATNSRGGQKWEIVKALTTLTSATVEEIAEVTGLAKAVVRSVLNRHKDYFVNITPGSVQGAWGLLVDGRNNVTEQTVTTVTGRNVTTPPPIGRVTEQSFGAEQEGEQPW